MSIEYLNAELNRPYLRPAAEELVRMMDSRFQYGIKQEPMFLMIPKLDELLGIRDQPLRFVFQGYNTAVRHLAPVAKGECCVLSVMLHPDIKRLDTGDKVILQRDLEVLIMNPTSHNIGSSGHRIIAASVKPASYLEKEELPLLYTGDSLMELAETWVRDMEADGDEMSPKLIKRHVMMNGSGLSEAEKKNVFNKMLRIRYKVDCQPVRDDVDAIARKELRELEWEQFGDVKEDDIRTASGNWDPRLTEQIRNRMMSLKFDIDCKRELESESDGDSTYSETDGDSKYSETDGDSKYSETDGDSKYSETDGDSKYSETDGDSTYSETEEEIAQRWLVELEKIADDLYDEPLDTIDIAKFVRNRGGSDRIRDMMIRLKFGIEETPEDGMLDMIAKRLYDSLVREYFRPPSLIDMKEVSYEVDPNIRQQVLNKMLDIKYGLR